MATVKTQSKDRRQQTKGARQHPDYIIMKDGLLVETPQTFQDAIDFVDAEQSTVMYGLLYRRKLPTVSSGRLDSLSDASTPRRGCCIVVDKGRVVWQGDKIMDGLTFIEEYGGGVLCRTLTAKPNEVIVDQGVAERARGIRRQVDRPMSSAFRKPCGRTSKMKAAATKSR